VKHEAKNAGFVYQKRLRLSAFFVSMDKTIYNKNFTTIFYGGEKKNILYLHTQTGD